MADQWMLRGKTYGNCNCAFGCPCQFNSPSTYGFCEGIINAQIEEGYFNDISLGGLCFVLAMKWPGEVSAGNGQQQLIIDDRADATQREALRKIAHGEATRPGATHFYIYNSTMSTVHETLYARIDMNIDLAARKGRTHIENLVTCEGNPLIDPHTGKETRRGIHIPEGFEFTYAEVGAGRTTVSAAFDLALNNSYAQFNIMHLNQDGLIRDSLAIPGF